MGKFPYKTWFLAALLVLMPGVANAAGLGKLNVLSSLGQPLVAEVELISVDKDDLSSMTASLSSPEAYSAANVPYSSALVGVHVSIEKRADGTPYIKITSVRAVNDPFIDFLIELNWDQGKLVRQYTALIDPPGFTLPGVASAPVAVAPPAAAPAAKPIETPAAATPPATAPAETAAVPAPAETPPAGEAAKPAENTTAETPAAEAKPEETKPEQAPTAAAPEEMKPSEETKPEEVPVEEAKTAPTEYKVKHGDTLYHIANSMKPEGVTVEQMLVALYRANPGAFVGNMNRLKAGKILRIPEEADVADTDQAKAVKEIRVQTASWNAYRKALAEAAANTPAQEQEQAATSGKITTTVEDKTAAQKAPQEVLKLSKGESATGKTGSPQEQKQAMEEEATAREKALAEANDRVAALEKQVQDMQHLLELKGVKTPASAAAPAMKAEAPPATAPTTPEAPKAESTPPAAQTAPATAPAPVAAAPAPPKKPIPPAAPKKPKVVTPPPGIVDKIMSEPLYLAGAGGALVLLGVVGYLLTRRRQSASTSGAKTGAKKKPPQLDSAPEFEATQQMPAAPSAMTQTAPVTGAVLDDVDPIQEADLYLNFGRDTQAEEVLKEALDKNPKHEEAHLKLLQIYANRKDKNAFEKTARMLKELTGGKGENWLKAAALGYSIDPTNSLYADGKAAAPAAAAPAAAGVDLDFDIDVSSRVMPAKTDVELEAAPEKTAFLQPGVAAQNAVEDITHDSGASGSNLIADITIDAPIEEGGVKTDIPAAGATARNEVIDFSADIPAAAGGKEFSPDKTMAMNIGKPENKGMDLELGEKDAAPLAPDFKLDFGDAVTKPPAALKLDDINLSLDEVTPPKADSGGKDERWFDVQTKFDLAKAYQEMGDKDGAREILQEVVKEGDAGQQEEARKLLDSLG